MQVDRTKCPTFRVEEREEWGTLFLAHVLVNERAQVTNL